MKFWQGAIIAVLVGIFGSAMIYLVSAPPRGNPVELIPPPTPAPLRVQIDGAVASPGMYELPQGSRVDDLISLAGGLNADADVSVVNLAALVQDAEHVSVPCAAPTAQVLPTSLPERSVTVDLNTPGDEPTPQPEGPIDINHASQEELETLPGIGPVIAARIIEYREENGPYQVVEDIQKVKGIGPATFDELEGLITVSP